MRADRATPRFFETLKNPALGGGRITLGFWGFSKIWPWNSWVSPDFLRLSKPVFESGPGYPCFFETLKTLPGRGLGYPLVFGDSLKPATRRGVHRPLEQCLLGHKRRSPRRKRCSPGYKGCSAECKQCTSGHKRCSPAIKGVQRVFSAGCKQCTSGHKRRSPAHKGCLPTPRTVITVA